MGSFQEGSMKEEGSLASTCRPLPTYFTAAVMLEGDCLQKCLADWIQELPICL